MPLSAYLNLPNVPGESRRVGHEDEIDILSIDWTMSQPSASGGGGRARARTISSPVTLGKRYDASSPYIALASATGRHFDEVVVSFRKDTGDADLDFLKMTLRNVVISSYSMSGGQEASEIDETLGLSFENVRLVYVTQSDDGSPGDEHDVEFDIVGVP